MACLSENACLGRHYAGKRNALSNSGERIKRLALRAVADDFIFNLGTGVPDAVQQGIVKLPHLIEREDPKRLFFIKFDGSQYWEGFDTVLQIDACIVSASLYVNGNFVTNIENTLMTALIRVDPFLRGKNSIYLKFAANEAGPDEVIRSLSLYHLPKSRVTDLFLKSRIYPGRARIYADVTVKAGDIGMAVGGSIILSLHDGSKTVSETEIQIPAFRKNHWASVRARMDIDDPRLWRPEDPFRYSAVIQLFRADGTIADVRRIPYGVRELLLKRYDRRRKEGPRLLLNGLPVTIKGAVARQQSAELPGLLSRMGLNAVRVVDPSDLPFLETCETEGLLVMCEAQLEIHANPRQRGRRKTAVSDPLERPFALLGEMVTRLQNHASVICWSIGSRKLFGNEVLGEFIRSLDDTRAVNCEGDLRFTVSDFFSASDCGMKELTAVAEHKAVSVGGVFKLLPFARYKHYPLLLCEAAFDTEELKEKFTAAQSIDRFLGVFAEIEGVDISEMNKFFKGGFAQSREAADG